MSVWEDTDKQLAAKSRLTPGKVCGACREPKQHTEDCSAVLKAELAAAQLWREKAEGLLAKLASRATQSTEPEYMKLYFCSECEQEWGYGHLENCLVGEAQALLTPPTPKPGSEGKTADAVISDFVQAQEPLGKEFAAVLHENLDSLLVKDKPITPGSEGGGGEKEK